MRKLVAVSSLAAALALAAAVPALAETERLTAEAGDVSAEVTWGAQDFVANDVRLRIVRAGVTLLDEQLLDEGGEPLIDRPVSLRARDLDASGEPEILLDLYTGGAHCCLYTRLYRHDPAAAPPYGFALHWWGNPGYAFRDFDRDGRPELRSSDDRFAYEFTSFAGSLLPVQIWRFDGADLVDVTREFPAVIRKDLASLWRLHVRERGKRDADVRGVIAAWVAEKYLVGERAAGLRRLERERKAGYLDGPTPWQSGRAFVRQLKRFLSVNGYA
jgi:hypothetical protein